MRNALEYGRRHVSDEQARNRRARVKAHVVASPLQVQPAQHAGTYDGDGRLQKRKHRRGEREHERGRARGAKASGNIARDRSGNERRHLSRNKAERHHGHGEHKIGCLPGELSLGSRACGGVDQKRPCQRAADADGREARARAGRLPRCRCAHAGAFGLSRNRTARPPRLLDGSLVAHSASQSLMPLSSSHAPAALEPAASPLRHDMF